MDEPDPVLLLLQDVARQRRLTRAAVARELGVSRAAVAGWLLGIEATARGHAERPASARRFVFTAQRVAVQRRIADLLGQPVEALATLSQSVGTSQDGAADEPVDVTSSTPVWQASEDVLEALAVQGFGAALGATAQLTRTLRHRTAEVIESVEGVAATLVVAEPRGRDRRVLYQYQIAVFVAVPAGLDDENSYCRGLRERIDRALATARVVGWWERGSLVPQATLRRDGRQLRLLGSLISPYIDRPRPPGTGLLTPGAVGASVPPLRLGALVGGQYAGAEPIAGSWAETLHAGHIRATDLVRRAADSQYRRTGRGSAGEHAVLLSDVARVDAGYIVHSGLHLLQTGVVPGAWLLSLEPDRLVEYPPLLDALVELRGVVVLLFMRGDWARLTAWRIAAAQRDSADPALPILDTASDAAAVTAEDMATLSAHQATADVWAERVEGWNDLMQRVLDARGQHADRPTLTYTLADLPADLPWYQLDSGVWRCGRGPVPAGVTVFPDAVDHFTDAWLLAAAQLREELLALTRGAPDAQGDPET